MPTHEDEQRTVSAGESAMYRYYGAYDTSEDRQPISHPLICWTGTRAVWVYQDGHKIWKCPDEWLEPFGCAPYQPHGRRTLERAHREWFERRARGEKLPINYIHGM